MRIFPIIYLFMQTVEFDGLVLHKAVHLTQCFDSNTKFIENKQK
jgi:hypothetical protein